MTANIEIFYKQVKKKKKDGKVVGGSHCMLSCHGILRPPRGRGGSLGDAVGSSEHGAEGGAATGKRISV